MCIRDSGYTDLDTLRVTVAEDNYDLYIIEGESPTDIVHQFRQLVGRSYIPPKWEMCIRDSAHVDEQEANETAGQHAEYHAEHQNANTAKVQGQRDVTADDTGQEMCIRDRLGGRS